LKKILLITPPSPYLLSDKAIVPLGILYVASMLREQKYDVEVLDLTGLKNYEKSVLDYASKEYDAYGLTATSPDFGQAVHILDLIKSVNTKNKVILGGPHATVGPQTCLPHKFDKIVAGDGWTGAKIAIEDESKQQLIFAPMLENFDDAPFPARDLIDMDSYEYYIGGNAATNVMTQLGCPYGCAFCSGRAQPEYRRMRLRSISNVMKELDMLHDQYGFDTFMIYDDEVNIIKKRTIELMKEFEKRNFKFRAYIKTNLFDEETAIAMKKGGAIELSTGVESGSDRILKIIEKGTTYQINKQFVDICRKYGIYAKAFCMIGLPGETYDDIMLTKKWILDAKPDYFNLGINTPYPGSPEYDMKEKYDLEFGEIDFAKEQASYSSGSKSKVWKSWVRTSALSSEELVRLRDEVDKECRKKLKFAYNSGEDGHGSSASPYEYSMGQGLADQELLRIKKFQEGDSFKDG
jgi:radical SAM superfamily enzyme YgiQ (UPF0313 family)